MHRPFNLGQAVVANFEQIEVIPCARSSELRDRDQLIDDTLQIRKGWWRSDVIAEFHGVAS